MACRSLDPQEGYQGYWAFTLGLCWLAGAQGARSLLACCVRLSPEKEPERFVALVERLQARGALKRLGLRPLLCASATGGAPDPVA